MRVKSDFYPPDLLGGQPGLPRDEIIRFKHQYLNIYNQKSCFVAGWGYRGNTSMRSVKCHMKQSREPIRKQVD